MPLNLDKIDLSSFGINEEDEQQTQLKANVFEAVKIDPVQHSEITNLSKESGVPEFAVKSDPKKVKQQLDLSKVDLDGMVQRSPNTSKFLSANMNNAVIAQEDVFGGLLEGIEETFRGLGRSIGIGFETQARGAALAVNEATGSRIDELIPAGAMPFGAEFEAQRLSRQFAADLGITTDEELATAKQETTERLIREIQDLQDERKALTPDDLNIVQEGVRAGIESLANMAPGVALMMFSGGRAAPLLATIGAQSFAGSYGDARSEGLSPEQSAWFASIDAGIEVGTELLPVGTLERIITGKSKGLTKQALKFAVQEMGTEQLATALQTINSYAFDLDEELKNAESAEEMVAIQLHRQAVTAIATVVAGGTQIGAASAINKTINKLTQTEQQKTDQATVEQRNLDKLNADAVNSKLRERDAESFKQFIRDADGDNNTHVYIDGVQTSLYLQGKTLEEIESDPALKILRNASRDARATGEDVAIPIDDFMGDLAGTDHFNQLREHMTMSDETVSPFRQEQHETETRDYVRKLMEQAEGNASEYVEAQEIYTTVRDQLVDSGTVNAANASVMAQVVPAWATAQAHRTGRSVQDVYEAAGLTIEGPQTGERARLEGEQVLTQQPVIEDQELADFLIEDIQEFSEISEDGLVKLYHRTSKENADKIRKSGVMIPKEDGLFFSTKREGQAEGFGDEVIEFQIPADKLQIDDIFEDEAHLRLPAKANQSNNIEQFLIKDEVLKQEKPDTSGARGYYDPSNSIIRLTESADLSTFLHEFGHFMYEMEASLNSDLNKSINNWYKRNGVDVAAEATKYVNGDFSVLKQGERTENVKLTVSEGDVTNFLDTGSTGNKDKDSAVRRAVHEQFARGFETYLMEGKAPSIELRNAFRTFARWLSQIYQALRGDLNVNIDDEMRQVFDRLLATEEQIAAAESRARIEPLFTDAAMAGMTEQEFADYQKRQEKVKDVQSETLRDKMVKAITRKNKQWWNEEKKDLIDEELDNLSKEKVYVTIARLKDGDIKLDHATVKEMIGEQRTDKLGRTSIRIPDKLRGMTAKGKQGVHPDEAAMFFGYRSGSEMLSDITNSPSMRETAESNAESRMVERHGDVFNDGTIEQQAEEAVQNEERGKLILHELKMLTRGTNQRSIERQTMKSIAEERIGNLSFREIHPGKYRKAEIQAAQESARMLAEGNMEGAAQAKTRQALNYYLGMAATEAKTETTKIIDRMARYTKKKVREEIQKAEGGYWDQIVRILERFEFKKSATLAQVDRVNQDINTWAKERMETDGDGLVLHNAVLNESYVTHWKNVAYNDLKGIDDSVKNIEHVARYANKLTRMGEEIEFNKLVDRWVSSMDEKVKTRFKSKRTDVVEGRNWGRWFMAQMTKIPFMASWLDGGERAGISHQILVQPLTDAYANELELWKTSGQPIMELINNRSKEDRKRHNRKVYIPEIDDHLYGHQIIAVALNTGNESNLRKLLLGEQWANPDNDAEINFQNPKLQAVLSNMTESDWKMVQQIWDQMDSLYPQLAEVHRRTTGLTPPKIEAAPVETEFGTFKGGYYPIKYDPNRSHRAAQNEDKLNAETESMFSNSASIQASVNAGSTNERTGFYDAIRLSLDVVPAHFQETIHYITHHDPVREINRLIRDQRVAETIKEKLGPEEFAQLKPWLNDVAKDGREAPNKMFWDSILQRLRFGVTLGAMGFKASTGIIQISGLSNTIVEVGMANVMQSARSILGSTTTMRQAWEFASENSKVMKSRTQTMDREIKNAMKRIEGKRGILAATQEVSMKHIALIQTYMVDLPSWHAAYIKGMKEWGDETRAFQYADWVVENVQGSGVTKDMARIMRGQSETGRMFTMFMTYFSSLWNMERDLVKGVKSGVYSTSSVAAKIMFLFTIPVLFEMMMRGEFSTDDDDEETMTQRILTGAAMYPIQSVPFVRDVANAVTGDFGYNISPLQSVIEQGTRTIPTIIERGFTDEEITKSQVKGATKFIGAAAGVPGTAQAWATGEHLYNVIVEGEEMTTHQLLFGPKRD